MATIGNAPVFPTQSVLPGNLEVTGNATINGTTNSVGALTENSNEVLNVTNNTFFATDFWRLTANTTAVTGGMVITSNLARAGANYGIVGTGMTESSGVFTFPSTGIWRIAAKFQMERYVTNSIIQTRIWTTSDGGTTNFRESSEGWTGSDDNLTIFNETHFDVTDTSQCTVQFGCQVYTANQTMKGDTTENRTCFFFQRLGDT